MHASNFENGAAIFICRHELGGYRQARAPDNNVRKTRIRNLRESTFSAEIKCDITHIRLRLGKRECKFMMLLIRYRIVWAEFDKIMGLECDNVGKEIATLEHQILHHKVERIICVFDAWDRNVSDLEGTASTLESESEE